MSILSATILLCNLWVRLCHLSLPSKPIKLYHQLHAIYNQWLILYNQWLYSRCHEIRAKFNWFIKLQIKCNFAFFFSIFSVFFPVFSFKKCINRNLIERVLTSKFCIFRKLSWMIAPLSFLWIFEFRMHLKSIRFLQFEIFLQQKCAFYPNLFHTIPD